MEHVKEIAKDSGAVIQRGEKQIAVYRDEEGVTHEHAVYMPQAAAQAIRWANRAERLSFEVYETDQEAIGGGS